MTEANFDLTFDDATGIVRVSVSGFWDVPGVSRLETDIARMAATARGRSDRIGFLIDAREAIVQAADVAEALPRIGGAAGPGEKWALLISSPLLGLQVARHSEIRLDGEPRRMANGSLRAGFRTIEAALRWLHEDPDAGNGERLDID